MNASAPVEESGFEQPGEWGIIFKHECFGEPVSDIVLGNFGLVDLVVVLDETKEFFANFRIDFGVGFVFLFYMGRLGVFVEFEERLHVEVALVV